MEIEQISKELYNMLQITHRKAGKKLINQLIFKCLNKGQELSSKNILDKITKPR